MRKPVFGHLRPGKTKPACSASEARYSIKILGVASIDISERQSRWSDCTDAQADLRLCCSYMTETDFLTTWLKFSGTVKNPKNSDIRQRTDVFILQVDQLVSAYIKRGLHCLHRHACPKNLETLRHCTEEEETLTSHIQSKSHCNVKAFWKFTNKNEMFYRSV